MTRKRFIATLVALAVAPIAAAKATQTPFTSEITTKLAVINAQFSALAHDLSDALARASGAAQEAGVSFGELICHIERAQKVTGRGGAIIGNSLKTLYTRASRFDVQQALFPSLDARLTGAETMQMTAHFWHVFSSAKRLYATEMLGGPLHMDVLRAIFTP